MVMVKGMFIVSGGASPPVQPAMGSAMVGVVKATLIWYWYPFGSVQVKLLPEPLATLVLSWAWAKEVAPVAGELRLDVVAGPPMGAAA